MNRVPGFISVLLVASASLVTQQVVPPIRNFFRVNNEFCTGAQPRLEHLEKEWVTVSANTVKGVGI
jgi:hypothetical protein